MVRPRGADALDAFLAGGFRGMETTPTGKAIEDTLTELNRAMKVFVRPFASAHEGFAILKEEVDELWEDVRMNQLSDPEYRNRCMRKEAIQVAAMAIRFVVEVCDDRD